MENLQKYIVRGMRIFMLIAFILGIVGLINNLIVIYNEIGGF